MSLFYRRPDSNLETGIMTLTTLFQTIKASPARRRMTRRISHSSRSRRSTTRPQLERLEDRLALSGFGPEDGSYIVEPWSGSYTDIKIQATDQKIVAAGTFSGPGVAIARYDVIGNRDTSYGSAGLTTTTIGYAGTTAGLVLQPDEKAIVASKKTSTGYFGAARFNANGSLDIGFGSGGWSGANVVPSGFTSVPMGVGLQSTGKLVVGGIAVESSQNPTAHSAVLSRFTTSGATDNGKGGFGNVVSGKAIGYVKETFSATNVSFRAVAIQQDDKVVAVGNFSPTRSASGQLIVARYTAAGVRDTTFNGSGYSVLNLPGISYTSMSGQGVAMQSDGKIVVVSTASGIDGSSDMLVARYNSNGTLDTSFGAGLGYVRVDIDGTVSQTSETGHDVTIQPDGKIVAIGKEVIWSATPGQPTNVLVARLNPNGTPDLTFGSGGFKIGVPPTGAEYHSFSAAGVSLQSDGSIIVAGGIDDQNSGGNVHPFLMRFFGTNSAIAPAVSRSRSSAAPMTDIAIADRAITLLLNEDLTTSNLKKNSASAVQTGSPAKTTPVGFGGTLTTAAVPSITSPVQKSSSSKFGLGKISSPDLLLSLDLWFGGLHQ